MAKNILRAEMIRRGVTYEGLSERLKEIGIRHTVPNLRNKIGRGKFTAIFFMQCMVVLGVKWIEIPESLD